MKLIASQQILPNVLVIFVKNVETMKIVKVISSVLSTTNALKLVRMIHNVKRSTLFSTVI